MGWTDWNFCLDLSGGPNWAGNVCDAPILVGTADATKAAPGTVDVFYKQPMYYYFGHVAAFAPPDSTRVAVATSVGAARTGGAAAEPPIATAVVTPDRERLVVVVMNRQDDACQVAVDVPPRGVINVEMAAHSIRTFVVGVQSE